MKIEYHVTSLELSKKLKDIGLTSESCLFWWGRPNNFNVYGIAYVLDVISKDENYFAELYPAFTVAELMEMLPSILYSDTASGCDFSLSIYKPNDYWHIGYFHGHQTKFMSSYPKLVDLLAITIISLIENGTMELPNHAKNKSSEEAN